MRRRFRRKRSGVWMPVYGQSAAGNTTDLVAGSTGNFAVDSNGGITYDAVPVTFDYTESAYQNQVGNQTQTLHDIVSGQEWRLRRIVGKCFAGAYLRRSEDGIVDPGTPPSVEVAAGYIVLRTDEEGDPVTDFAETNPLVQESAEDPWIWRRKWIFAVQGNQYIVRPSGTPGYDQLLVSSIPQMPTNNTAIVAGGVSDGPHIDQKTARVIHRQERLFFMVAARVLSIGIAISWTNNTPVQVWYNVDHRFFGSLQFNRGNRRNASR